MVFDPLQNKIQFTEEERMCKDVKEDISFLGVRWIVNS